MLLCQYVEYKCIGSNSMEDCEKYENQLVTQIVTIWCFEGNTKQNGGTDEDIINWIGRMVNVETRVEHYVIIKCHFH